MPNSGKRLYNSKKKRKSGNTYFPKPLCLPEICQFVIITKQADLPGLAQEIRVKEIVS